MSNPDSQTERPALSHLLPETEDFLMKVPLYKSFGVDNSCFGKIYRLENFQGNIDWFCIECNRSSIFEGDNNDRGLSTRQGYPELERVFHITLVCQRNRSHVLLFIFKVSKGLISKIGQYPSIADLYSGELNKYRRILGDEKYREFSRAVGLVSHGVGIGAFVYLRRIFEGLIEEAHEKPKSVPEWDEDQYLRSRMDEKILLLQDYLPTFLVENRGLYSIMSVGIHSLTESQCLEYFDTVKIGIELILDEKIEQERKQTKLDAAKRAIAEIKGKLN